MSKRVEDRRRIRSTDEWTNMVGTMFFGGIAVGLVLGLVIGAFMSSMYNG